MLKIQESGEMYLETIYILSANGGKVRSLDVADHIGFSKQSVCRAVGLLRKNEYITVDDNGHLFLTETGLSIAKKIYERHTLLTDLLLKIGVDPKTAAEDACKMEHVISDSTFDALKKHASTKN